MTRDDAPLTLDDLEALALEMPGAYPDRPFGPEVLVVKVKAPSAPTGRIFVQLFELHGEPTVTFACDPEHAEEYRAMFPGVVVRGYHAPPVQQPYVNTMPCTGAVPDDVLLEMLDHAYEATLARMPKKHQRELAELAPPE